MAMVHNKTISLPDVSETNLLMGYPSGNTKLPTSGLVLAADVGGTKTDLAVFKIENSRLVLVKTQRYPTTSQVSFVSAIREFIKGEALAIDCACFGVAGVVEDNKVKGVNFAWEIDAKKLEKELNVKSILLINDLEASAYGLSGLKDSDFEMLSEGQINQGHAAIIAPGTGLGEAGLFWDGQRFYPYASEGGHCSFSPRDLLDIELWKFLNTTFSHISWERLVSGQGISNIYRFLRSYRGIQEPEWLTEKLRHQEAPIVISTAAKEKSDPICIETIQFFLKYLSVEAAQLALKSKATGGIYIGGGIVPKIRELIDKPMFYSNFINAGRMENLLKSIPIKIVLNDKTPLIGAAYYAAMGIEK